MNKNKTMIATIAVIVLAACVAVAKTNSAEAVEIAAGEKTVTPFSEEGLASLGSPYHAAPKNAKLLHEYGGLVLFAGETESDVAFNAAPKRVDDDGRRNSLFLRRRTASGKVEWRLMLTSGGEWKEADGMSEWGKDWVVDVRKSLNVVKASLTRDGRYIWMVCDPSCAFFYVVCRFDLRENTLAVLIDGDSADEEEDGTIRVKGKKFYPNDDRGAAWHDVWITPNGKIVREGKITLRGSDL